MRKLGVVGGACHHPASPLLSADRASISSSWRSSRSAYTVVVWNIGVTDVTSPSVYEVGSMYNCNKKRQTFYEYRVLVNVWLYHHPSALMVGTARQSAAPLMFVGQHAVWCESRILAATPSSERCLCSPLVLRGCMRIRRRSEAFIILFVWDERVNFLYDGT